MNMISLNKKFFQELYKVVNPESGMRFHACIVTTDEDKDFINKARNAECYQSLNLKTALIKLSDDQLILVVKGTPQLAELPDGLKIQRLDENAGLITVLGGIGFFDIKNKDIIEDKNWATVKATENGDKNNVSFVDYSEILEVVDEFSVFEILQSPFDFSKDTVDRFLLLLLIMLNIGDSEKLKVKAELLSIVITLDKFPFHLLHSSYISQTWQYSYIDLYRCIELLYPIPKMIELRKALNSRRGTVDYSHIRAIDFFEDVNKTTGWREIEQSGLESLVIGSNIQCIERMFSILEKIKVVNFKDAEIINELSKSEIMRNSNFKKIFEQARDLLTTLSPAQMPLISEYKTKKCAKLIAKFLYSTRNELVHFRTHGSSYSEDKIKAAFMTMIILINEVFDKHQEEAYSS